MHPEPDDLHEKYKEFLTWERRTRDAIDVKRAYIEMAGDAATGLLLSQIVYYYLPASDGSGKLRVQHDGEYWIAKRRKDWWSECRLRPGQADYAIAKLKARSLVETATYKFNGTPTQHVRLRMDVFLDRLGAVVDAEIGKSTSQNEDSSSQKGNATSRNDEVDFVNSGSPPYIDNSSKTTAKITHETTAETARSTTKEYFSPDDGASTAAAFDKHTANSFLEEEPSDDLDYSEALSIMATIEGFDRHLPSEGRLKRYFTTQNIPPAAVVSAALAMQAKVRYVASERRWWYDSPDGPRWYSDLYTRLMRWAKVEQSESAERPRERSKDVQEPTIEQIQAMSDEELAVLKLPFNPHTSNLFAIRVAAIRQERQRATAST